MRPIPTYAFILVIALTLSGCSVASSMSGSPLGGSTGSSSAPAVAGATPVPPPQGATLTPNDPTAAAIQAVIQKADQAQQDAFNKNDPTLMQETATSSYYNQLVQINSDMANAGVTSIKLVSIDQGSVTLTSPTTAQATTYETWETTYRDGTSDQSRQLNVYTLVQQQGAWKIQSDDHPNFPSGGAGGSPASGPSGTVPPSPPTVVPPPVTTPASGGSTSRNWSGYAATSGSFTGVTGTWTVPQLLSSGGLASDATWVGIGGVNSRDLVQAGTEETTNRSGTVQWDAWIETLPQPSRQVQFAVKPGDSITVSINQQGSNQWLIQFTNNTTGESYQTTIQYASSLSSAEWIEEAPSVGRGGRILPLNNFGAVQFSGGKTIQNGNTVTIAQAGAQPITLVDASGSPLVKPSVLTSDGQGFTVSQSGSQSAP